MRGIGAAKCILAGLVVALGGCYDGRSDHNPGMRLPEDADDPAGADGDGSGGDDGGVGDQPSCGGDGQAVAPLRRLTRLEYDNTVRDLLGDDTRPASGFTPDEKVAGYAANAIAPLSKTQLDEYLTAAEDLADTAVATRWDLLVECDLGTDGCVDMFIADFGERAFRRPLTPSQIADYRELYASAQAQWGDTEGVAAVVTAMLMSPNFLYHLEPTGGTPGELVALDDHALASRLSYFVWASMPDEELLDAATEGRLGDPDELAAQTRRLLDDSRADAAIASFHEQWLGTERLESATKDPARFPEWSPDIVAAALEESGRFAARVVRDGDGTLRTLLTADWTVADPTLAELYGVAAPAPGDETLALDPSERAGLLTQIGFLAANAHAAEVSWVHRGKFVREQMLCNVLPPPPPGVEVNEANDPSRVDDPNCMGCHLMMDPIGQGFDEYSAIGVFRTEDDAGQPVTADGEVVGVEDIGRFEGAIELAHALAESSDVEACVARQWFRFATHRAEAEGDDCTVQSLTEVFAASDGNVRELIVALVQSDAFRFRTQPAGD